MSSGPIEIKNEPEVVMVDDDGDDSSPDSTPLAAGRTLPATASSNDKTAEKDIEAVPPTQENKEGEDSEMKEGKEQAVAPQPEPPSKSAMLTKQIQELVSLRRVSRRCAKFPVV